MRWATYWKQTSVGVIILLLFVWRKPTHILLNSDDIDSIADEDSPSLSAKEYVDLLNYVTKHFIVG